jgi:DNA repair exonuclease SbcCD nuclease subunit
VHCGFLPRDVERTGAAFALLGHYHGARVSERFAYPGSPEALDFGESGDHFVLKLDVGENGVQPELLPFGTVRYVTHRLDVTGVTTSDELRAAIAALGDREAIVRTILEGELSADVDLDVPALYNACVEHFRFLDLADRTRPDWRLDEIAEESTTKGAFVRLLQERAEAATPEEAEVARMALTLGLQAFDRREVRVP